ncbi:hypothetical protein [Neorhizobium sp. JUb45]|uniref:hypothetical protein n=1 Tax=Neorhizobium sp. JUb45 TaxID=2485113 RepID=UPI00104B23C8|nr:hypothetical protein [Neorhizobium sp. JUb45]TCR02196.1 hypothetical protein EDF70_104479 [Neorhizobium sp. JUb45]
MADSEDSRNLPSNTRTNRKSSNRRDTEFPSRITRKNLLSATAQVLLSLTYDLEKAPERNVPGPTSTARLWLNWYEAHQRLARITKYQQQIESKVLAMAGAFPVVQMNVSADEPAVTVYSLADIDRLKSRVDATKLAAARSLLRKRRESWNSADRELGYSPALAFEHDLAEQERRLSRVLSLSRPKTTVEIAAKLHCLLSMEDPGNKFTDAPWADLRRILLDLIEVMRSRAL